MATGDFFSFFQQSLISRQLETTVKCVFKLKNVGKESVIILSRAGKHSTAAHFRSFEK